MGLPVLGRTSPLLTTRKEDKAHRKRGMKEAGVKGDLGKIKTFFSGVKELGKRH